MNIFGIGLPEMILIMLVALLIFGPKKLPEIGRSMGKAIKGFQDASREFESEFKREADRLEQSTTETAQAPVQATPEVVATPVAAVTPSEEVKEVANVTPEVVTTPAAVTTPEEVKELANATDA